LLLCVASAWARDATDDQEARVQVARTGLRIAVRRALHGALERLRDAECIKVFSDFRDGQGNTLQANLDALGVSAEEHARSIWFVDGSSQRLCRDTTVLAATKPGGGVVFVCERFGNFQLSNRRRAEAVLLHEVLHTLGLGENPPTPREITDRVLSRCYAGQPRRM